MLTMDTLLAVFEALDMGHVKRVLLVGDPNQLPPIGVGRPFADLIASLEGCAESSDPKVQATAAAMARLTVEVRAAPGAFALAEGLSSANNVSHTNLRPLLYFSYVTLSTLGYGDITPVKLIACSLAALGCWASFSWQPLSPAWSAFICGYPREAASND